jgi:hypothetical protein
VSPLRSAWLGAVFALAAAVPAVAASLPSWARAVTEIATPAVDPDCPAVVLCDRTSIQVGRDLRLHTVRRRAVRILTSEGTESAALAVRIEPGGAIEDFNAWTWSADGVRATAGMKQRVESMLSSEGPTDVRRVALSAPAARAGDVAFLEAVWNEPAPFPAYLWLPMETNLPVVRAELALDLPKGWSAGVHGFQAALENSSSQPEVIRLAIAGLPRFPDEARRPADSRLVPRVLVSFDDDAKASRFRSWDALATWFEEFTRQASGPGSCPAELRTPAARGDTLAVAAELAHRVQMEVRYVAVELGMRRWQPDSAASTWQLRYGDCKDKAALLVSALEANGIRARLVLACTHDQWDVDPDSPHPFQFNHCIVAMRWPGPAAPAATVTTKSGQAWTLFDPTDDDVPLGCISPALGGTLGLIAGPDGGLVRFPAATPADIRRVVTARLGSEGDLRGRLVVTANGPTSGAYRGRFGSLGTDGLRARARDYLAGHWPRATLDSCAVLVDSAAANRFSLGIDFRLQNAVRTTGNRWLYAPRFDAGAGAAPPNDTTRTLPIELGSPGRFEEEWQVELPPGFTCERRAPIECHGPAGDYVARIEPGPARLTVTRRLELRAGELPASEFAQAKALLKAMYAGDRASVLLTRP